MFWVMHFNLTKYILMWKEYELFCWTVISYLLGLVEVNPLTVTPLLKNLKVHYLKLNCYNSWMLLSTGLRLVSF